MILFAGRTARHRTHASQDMTKQDQVTGTEVAALAVHGLEQALQAPSRETPRQLTAEEDAELAASLAERRVSRQRRDKRNNVIWWAVLLAVPAVVVGVIFATAGGERAAGQDYEDAKQEIVHQPAGAE